MRINAKFAVRFLSFLLAGPAVFGQFETSEVLGTVRDSSGAVTPNAQKTLLQQATGIKPPTGSKEEIGRNAE